MFTTKRKAGITSSFSCCGLQIGYRDASLLKLIESAVVSQAKSLTPSDIVCLASACSKLSWDPPQLLSTLTAATAKEAAKFQPQALLQALHHLTQCRAATPGLLEEASDVLLPNLKQLQPADLSLLASVCARNGFHDGVLLDGMARAALKGLGQWKPWMFARLAGACSTLGYYNAELCAEVTRQFQQQLQLEVLRWQQQQQQQEQQMQPQQVMQPDSAAAAVSTRVETAAGSLGVATASMSGAEVSAMCYSLARLGHRSPALLDVAVAHGLQQSSSYSPVALSTLTWALVVCEHQREDWVEEVGRQGLELASRLPTDQVRFACASAYVERRPRV